MVEDFDDWFAIRTEEQFTSVLEGQGLRVHRHLTVEYRETIVEVIAKVLTIPTDLLPILKNVSRFGKIGHAYLWESLVNSDAPQCILQSQEFLCFAEAWYISPCVVTGLTTDRLDALAHDLYFLSVPSMTELYWNDHGGYGPGLIKFDGGLMVE